MANLLCYSRNRATSVEQIDDATLASTCSLQDSLTDAEVSLRIRLPELEIIHAKGSFTRSSRSTCEGVEKALAKVVGVRIGAGMKKIIRGLVSETTDCMEVAVLVEECCHAVILAFTKEMLTLGSRGAGLGKGFFCQHGQEKYPFV